MFANICIFALFVSLSHAGYAGSYGGNYLGGGGGGGAGGAGGYGYGYSGAFPSYPAPFYPPIPFDFGTLMAGTNAKAYTSVSVEPPFNGKISARARITFQGLNQLQARLQQQAAAHAPAHGGAGGYAFSGSYPAGPPPRPRAFSAVPPISNGHQGGGGGGYTPSYATGFSNSGGYGGGYGGSYGGGYGGAFAKAPIPLSLGAYPGGYGSGASATIGGDGVKQTAFLSPENPASPNVNVRFGGSPSQGTSKSVYVSSSSSSGNVNGTPYHQRHASTTVNDNGKVSTYTVHDK